MADAGAKQRMCQAVGAAVDVIVAQPLAFTHQCELVRDRPGIEPDNVANRHQSVRVAHGLS